MESRQIPLSELLQSKVALFDKFLADLPHLPSPVCSSVKTLLMVSDFACRKLDLLRSLVLNDHCLCQLSREDYFSSIRTLSLDSPQDVFMRDIRAYRNTHLLHLMLLELAGAATTEEVMYSWSDCADALITHVLTYCNQALQVRYGIPRNDNGEKVLLHTLAMGKLGGRELNYSSDIDLIFAFSEGGETDGEEVINNSQFFTKLVQNFVHLIQHVTVDGFVFRVDLRLRPNGDSGPLVYSLAAMETYYQDQGRDWERYAMAKARVITKQLDEHQSWFDRLIIPFVYRRYVDFSVIESLRSMKALIEREVQLNPRLDDIKRGQGGIREIEFIIQNFQLIRGGRLPQLQQRNALLALAALKQAKLLPRCDALNKAYLFLRKLENALQGLDDKQTHSLPTEAVKQAQITLAMGFSQWEALLDKLQQFQRIVSHSFNSVLGKVDAYEDEKRLLSNQLASLWQWHIEESMAINLLTSLGYENAQQCFRMIYEFRHSRRCRRLPQGARLRLDRFMIMLLTELAHFPKTDEVLLEVIHLLENIVGRSAYLALLTENPQALKELLFWLANSPFITSLLANQPFLLEILLTQQQDWRPLSRKKLEKNLAELLQHSEDVEAQEDSLRQFKLTQWLMAARAEVYGACDAIRIGQFLTDVAEVIIIAALNIACEQLSQRYPKMRQVKANFAIIAYGKLGSREMNFTSDLDLVFLHTVRPSEEALVTRLTQKIVHMLTTRTRSGVLYPVDTRLRPSGSAGLLVSHVDAFVAYQQTHAWTWEHQALLKARVISANPRIKKIFLALKQSILSLTRDVVTLKQEVLTMRAKMDQHQEVNPIKHSSGGLLDLEFLVQFLVLRLGDKTMSRYTHTLVHLRQLYQAQVVTREQYSVLKKAYKNYHRLLHRNTIQPAEVQNDKIQFAVAKICSSFYQS